MVTTGDLRLTYSVIRVVGAVVDNRDSVPTQQSCGGCGGPAQTRVLLSPNELFKLAEKALLSAAREAGGDAVVFARFEHRVAVETLQQVGNMFAGGAQQKAASFLELVAYGTAVKTSA